MPESEFWLWLKQDFLVKVGAFLLILAFALGNVYSGGMTISWCLIAGLFMYRFILTYAAIHNQVKVNPFHFFLYLCAFEIAPLLLIYKGLLLFFHQTT